MPVSKKPRRVRRRSHHEPISPPTRIKMLEQRRGMQVLFDMFGAVLQQIARDGTVDAMEDGDAVFCTPDGQGLPVVPSLHGFLCIFEAHQVRSGRAMPMEPLTHLAKKLADATPIEHCEVEAASSALDALRVEALRMEVGYAASLIQSAQIRVELEMAGHSDSAGVAERQM